MHKVIPDCDAHKSASARRSATNWISGIKSAHDSLRRRVPFHPRLRRLWIIGHVQLAVEEVGSLPKSLGTLTRASLGMPSKSVRFSGHDKGHFIVVVVSRFSAPDLFGGFAILANPRPITGKP